MPEPHQLDIEECIALTTFEQQQLQLVFIDNDDLAEAA